MSNIKINVKNQDKLSSLIESVEKKCSIRLISVEGIRYAVEDIEKRLENLLYKKDWKGLRFWCDNNAQTFPMAYKGTPESTQFIVERGVKDWFVSQIQRSKCCTKSCIPLNIELKKENIALFLAEHF
jgi:hypothetical protein